jgi:Carboxypeptidase regulatory-like domain
MIPRPLLVCTLALLMAIALFAQAPASLRGVVTDPSGAGVPGASVTVTGPGGLVRVVQTSDNGSYSIPNLPPGTYALRIAAKGFSLFESMQIELTAARALTADAKLTVAAEKQEVTVTDTSQVQLDPSQNAGAIVISGQDLDMLSDDPDDLQSDLTALAGPAAGPNGGQIFVDGFSNGQLPPKDSIREIRINSNPFSAEFDRIGYGRIEILTKPGTDKLHGSVFYQTDSGALDARNPFATEKPSFLTQQFQGTLSGSINKKTSFFLDFSDRHQDDQALIKATILGPDYLPEPLTQNVPTPTSRLSFSPRVDHQLNSKVTLQARYTFTRSTSDNTGVGGFNLATQGVDTETTTQSAQLIGTWVVNARAINESRFQYTRSANSQSSVSAVPTINVNGYFTGNAATQGPQYTDQGSYELQNYTSLTRGAHLLKFGIRLRATREADFNDSTFNGMFLFKTLTAYSSTLLGLQQNLPWPQILLNGGGAFQYVVAGGAPLLNINQVDVSPYVQDDWHIIPSLTLSLGLRYEAQSNIHDKGDFAPRIGVAWGLGGNQGRLRQPKTVIRAGFGLFYDRFALAQVLTSERFNGFVQQRYIVQNPQFFFTDTTDPLSVVPAGTPSVTYKIDPELVAPRIIQSAIGVDRQLPKNITLSVSYYNSRGVHELRTVNINAPLPGTYPLSPLYPMGNANPVYEYQSSGLFKQSQLSANINARLNARYSMFGYYSLGTAHSNTDGVNTFPADTYDQSNEWSRAQFDVRHRAVMGGSMTAPFGIRLNPFLTYASAAPFNIVSNQDSNGDTVNNDRPSMATAADVAASNAAVAAGRSPFVFATAYGLLNSRPTPGEALIPRNFGNGFGNLTINLRVSRSWGFGETTTSPGRPGGAGGGPRGGGLGGGRGGGGGGGRGGFLGGAATNKRYNLIASVDIRNLLNSVNPSAPVGTLGSPFFGEAQGIVSGFGGGATQSANRRLEMQLRFSF